MNEPFYVFPILHELIVIDFLIVLKIMMEKKKHHGNNKISRSRKTKSIKY
jgi:hypothetical protein